MAKAIALGVEDSVTLATTVTRLTMTAQAKKLLLVKSDVNVYLVTSDVADGAALPSTGRIEFASTALPKEVDISPYGQVGLAGVSAGTCRVLAR
jgi:hypothetical protein